MNIQKTNYQLYIDAIPDAAILVSDDNAIRCFNQKAQSYLGLKKKKHLGKNFAEIIKIPDIAEFLSSNDATQKISQGIEVVSPFDKNLVLFLSILPYPDGSRLLLARNISKFHRLNKMRKNFVANVSHELRTPLTVIKGYLELVQEYIGDNEVLQPPIQSMQEQSKNMENLIQDLLTLSKLEANTDNEVKKQLINIPDLISALIKDARHLNARKKHQIKTNIDESLLILGNEVELQSAFSNLISNAIRYTPDKGVISIEWFNKNKLIYFSVTDNGDGIAPKHLNRLTERFYRVDKGRSRSEGGTGLGLSIVKHILRHHNAELIIHSKVGKGSTFSCQFPA